MVAAGPSEQMLAACRRTAAEHGLIGIDGATRDDVAADR